MPIIDKNGKRYIIILVNNTSIIKHGGSSNMTTPEKENIKNILEILREVVEDLKVIVGDKEGTSEIIQEMTIKK